MKLKLNLLENSYDYLSNSFDLYQVADEYGIYDKEKSDIQKKIKWKLAFVTMVQAVELLLKEILFEINPNLVFDNIDFELINPEKTVSCRQAINRINNISNKNISKKDVELLKDCIKLRNKFIHYDVDVNLEFIRDKYHSLYALYSETHNIFLEEKVPFNQNKYEEIACLIKKYYDEEFTIFRGRDISKKYLMEIKKEIRENENFHYYVTKDGSKIKRIRYGKEKEYFNNTLNLESCDENMRKQIAENINRGYDIYEKYRYCDDCGAKKGEYHLEGCDLERCPVCGGQLIMCNCIIKKI